MKCFYCSKIIENEKEGFCIGCGKKLGKICSKCKISYENNANFCMSCGGKLTSLSNIESKNDNDEEEVFILEEVADTEIIVEPAKTSIIKEQVELDLGFQDENETIPQKNPFLKKDDEDTDNSSKHKIKISVEEKSVPESQKGMAEFSLEIEKKAKKQTEETLLKEKLADPTEPEIFVSPNAPKPKSTLKQAEKKDEKISSIKKVTKVEKKEEQSIDFDSLFDELTSLNGTENIIVEPEEEEIEENLSPIFPDINQEDVETDGAILNISNDKIFVKQASHYTLKPAKVNEKYDVSLESLINETVTEEFKESCIPLFKKIEENLCNCKGGTFFLKGNSGSGKSLIVNRLKKFAEKNTGESGYSVVVADSNIFDFDFLIFINLIRSLMRIKSNDVNTVRKKFNKLFGETLPDSKKECLSALICLNFVPVKTKLPKHDIEYLLAYVLYGLSRSKPVLWILNNANALNVRSIKFFSNLKKILEETPLAVVFVVDPDAAIITNADEENVFEFKGFSEEKLIDEVSSSLNTKRIPSELEKLLKEKAAGNMLFTIQLAEYLKDRGFIFEMKGSWRFSKLPEDFICPSNLDELISNRVDMLPGDVSKTLKEFTLLNLYEVPKSLFTMVSSTGASCVMELVKKGYLIETQDSFRFSSRSILTALKKKIKIGKQERVFYREVVTKLAAAPNEIYQLNKHWLLLSYINLGGIIDRRMNSFLFSSAVYMEKLGFFEISQRSYQTIVSSFDVDDTNDDFRILPEIKNARLWRIVEPEWAKIFWEKLVTYSKIRNDYHLEMVSRGELLLLEKDGVDMTAIADIVKKLHLAGCYEEEIGLIDRTTDILINSGNYLDANTFATRGYKILRDVIVKYDGKGVSPAEFVYALYIRCACKLAEVCLMLKDHDKGVAILEEALEYAEKYSVSYFKSKILFLLGKLKFLQKDEWETMMKEGFYNAIIGMDFTIVKAFLYFFEENGFEEKEWVSPFIEYKNWINF